MRTKLNIRVLDEDGVIKSVFNLEFQAELILDCFVETIIDEAVNMSQAILQTELVTYPIHLNGIELQRRKQ